MLLAKKQPILKQMHRQSTLRRLISKEPFQISKGILAKKQPTYLSSLVTKSVVILGVLYVAMNVVLHYTQTSDK